MNVAVVGAGLAGLAAACELADLGHTVTVYEKRPWAGGKTYSFAERETGDLIDNGQHVYMTCTTAYRAFLRRIGSAHLARRQRRLAVRVFDAAGREGTLRALPIIAPLHLGPSFAFYPHVRLLDRARIAPLLLRIAAMSDAGQERLHDISFAAWLRRHWQTDTAIRDFWDWALLPTLNCRSEESSAAAALFVFREGFLKSAEAAAIGISTVPLSELQVEPAIRYLQSRGGSVRTGSGVSAMTFEGVRATGVVLSGGAHEDADGVVCAVPHRQVGGLLPASVSTMEPFASLAAIPTAPIVNVHLWFDREVADWPFAAFVGNELQWVFNRTRIEPDPGGRPGRLVVSLSAAQDYVELAPAAIVERIVSQLRAAVPGARDASVLRHRVVKEMDATFVPAPGVRRPPSVTPVSNLVLAGAYTATGWPATMESAVRSGITAATALAGTFAGALRSPPDGAQGEARTWESPHTRPSPSVRTS